MCLCGNWMHTCHQHGQRAVFQNTYLPCCLLDERRAKVCLTCRFRLHVFYNAGKPEVNKQICIQFLGGGGGQITEYVCLLCMNARPRQRLQFVMSVAYHPWLFLATTDVSDAVDNI